MGWSGVGAQEGTWEGSANCHWGLGGLCLFSDSHGLLSQLSVPVGAVAPAWVPQKNRSAVTCWP